jgi:hypothetical protein
MKSVRLLLIAFILTSTLGWSEPSMSDAATVDFKNFSYPWVYPTGWPDHLQWMSLKLKQHIELVNGKWDEGDPNERTDGEQFSGLTLEEVDFTSLSGTGSKDAIVVLRYDSGGTQNHYWVYLYGDVRGTPKLLGFFHAGDRAQYGLYQVSATDNVVTVRLFDPKFRLGDCCSSGYLNYQFRWNGQGFAEIGHPTPGRPDSVSRRPVSVFGIPPDQR